MANDGDLPTSVPNPAPPDTPDSPDTPDPDLTDPRPTLPSVLPRSRAARGALALAGAVTLVGAFVVGQQVGPPPAPAPGSGGAVASPSEQPRASDLPAASPTAPGLAHEDDLELAGWAATELPPVKPVAELVATKSRLHGISQNATFTLRSLTATSAADLAAGLTVEPAVAFTTRAGPGKATVTIRPTTELAPGIDYRFTLRTGGLLAGSWVFRTSRPPRIVEMLPRRAATDVPRTTSVEVTFDQDGIGDITPYFRIAPQVAGHLEQHGRTWVFLPHRPLAWATLYTVTVRHGVPLSDSDQALAEDLAFAFETERKPVAGSGSTPTKVEPWFPTPARDVVEVNPVEAPLLAFDAIPARVEPPVLAVSVHRFRDFGDAVDAYIASRGAPDWARWSTKGLVPTDDVPLILTFSATVETAEGAQGSWIRFPEPIERGWYLVVLGREGRDRQVFLQVTDLAAYVAVTSTDTLAWVNDVTTAGPVAGASVRFLGKAILGRTNGDGVASGPTPPTVRAAWARRYEWMYDQMSEIEREEVARSTTVIVRAPDAGPATATRPGRATFVPVTTVTGRPYVDNYVGSDTAGQDRDINLFSIARRAYRRTDRVDAWGLVREGVTGKVPATVELRISSGGSDDASLVTPAVVAKVDRATGTFKASMPFRDLPYGSYDVIALVDGEAIGYAWFSVEEILKPTYRLSLATDRHVVIEGDPLAVTVTATFFDDTPAAGLPVQLYGSTERELTTDGSGTATVRDTVRWTEGGARSWYTWRDFSAHPLEGDPSAVSSSSDSIVVFPSAVWLAADALFKGERLVVTASTTKVDVAALEKERAADPWDWNPAGGPPARAGITVQVTEITLKKVATGATYDAIRKRSMPTHAWVSTERDLGTRRAATGPDGTVNVAVPVGVNDKEHRVHVVATDSSGRATETTFTVYRPWPATATPPPVPFPTNGLVWPHLGNDGCGWSGGWQRWAYSDWYEVNDPEEARSFRIGDPVQVPFRDREGGLMPRGGANRYLFYLSQLGLREARVQASPVFVDTFHETWAPNASLAAVQFTGTTYVPAIAPYELDFDETERELSIAVTTDRDRYRPGDAATVTVRTTDERGSAVDATVFVRVIDEKLYAMDVVTDADPLSVIYHQVDAGLITTYGTHQLPVPPAQGCYAEGPATTGGGDGEGAPLRDDFRDVLAFARIRTGADGIGTASFDISDDLTTWRVSAAAVTADLQAGTGQQRFSVGLPFFIEAPLTTTLVVGDRPTLRVRAFGTALGPTSRTRFTVSMPDAGMAPRTVTATGYSSADIPLPELPVGEHKVRITASMTSGGTTRKDALVRTIRVVSTHFTDYRTVVTDLRDGVPPATGDGMATYLFTDGGRGRYLDSLFQLLYRTGDRVDTALAAGIARDILVEQFGVDAADLPERTDVGAAYQNQGGITLLPFSAPDLQLSVRVALAAPDAFNRWDLVYYFTHISDSTDESRERRAIALAGRASLGDDVLEQVRAMLADPALTIRERLYLALGAAVLGDHATALANERALLEQFGERFGQQVRLRVGSSLDDTLEATALVAMIGVIVGDPVAPQAEAYVEENPGHDNLYFLQQAAFIHRALDRLPADAGRFSYWIGGKRQDADLDEGALWLRLTPSQRTGFRATVRDGEVSVAVTYTTPVDPGAISRDPSVRLERSTVPASPLPRNAVVQVRLQATFSPLALDRCYWVTDIVPSGLVATDQWLGHGTEDYDSEAIGPWWVDGSRVSFCAYPPRKTRSGAVLDARTVRMAYWARVVMPGSYRWEPALIHAAGASDHGALVPETTITIR